MDRYYLYYFCSMTDKAVSYLFTKDVKIFSRPISPSDVQYFLLSEPDIRMDGMIKISAKEYFTTIKVRTAVPLKDQNDKLLVETYHPISIETRQGKLFEVVPNPGAIKCLAEILVDVFNQVENYVEQTTKTRVSLELSASKCIKLANTLLVSRQN